MSRVLEMATRHITKAVKTAEAHYGKKFKLPSIVVKDAKSRGGYCKISGFMGFFSSAEIMISSYYFRIKGAKWLQDTCYHEVAHYITHCLHGRVSPHGAEWKRVMRVCFDRKPDRCFSLTAEERVKQLRTKKVRRRKERTPAQVQADRERMAKVREARRFNNV